MNETLAFLNFWLIFLLKNHCELRKKIQNNILIALFLGVKSTFSPKFSGMSGGKVCINHC